MRGITFFKLLCKDPLFPGDICPSSATSFIAFVVCMIKRLWTSNKHLSKIKKIKYFTGTKDLVDRECKDLDSILELYLDGVRVTDLPAIESVVILNIPCWGAGVRPWELGSGHESHPLPSYNDKKLEVFCVYSSFHIAQMQVSSQHTDWWLKMVALR